MRVEQGAAPPELVQGGTRLFLVKVLNDAGVTAPLAVAESEHRPRLHARRSQSPEPKHVLTEAHVRERWADMSIYTQPPMRQRLSGLGDRVRHPAGLQPRRGPALGARQLQRRTGQPGRRLPQRRRSAVHRRARRTPVRIASGTSTASRPPPAFTRAATSSTASTRTSRSAWRPTSTFSRRSIGTTARPISLPPKDSSPSPSRAARNTCRRRSASRSAGASELIFQLLRWIDPSQYGWYSGDHHIHSAGCSHYENPTEGVRPEDMWPQIDGEALNLASVLTWGPSYYFQKQFFSGDDHPLSTPSRLMHYDLEVSGFPSSHAGHLVLLGLKDQDYPGTKRLEDWPTWTLPILQVGKGAGRGRRLRALGLGPRGQEQRAPELRDARLRRHRRQRVHRRRHASRHRRFHLRRRHAVRLGAEHLVPHAQRRVPHPHQRRNRLSVHHRRQGRPGAFVREGRRPADVSQVARRGPRRAELRLRRQDAT